MAGTTATMSSPSRKLKSILQEVTEDLKAARGFTSKTLRTYAMSTLLAVHLLFLQEMTTRF